VEERTPFQNLSSQRSCERSDASRHPLHRLEVATTRAENRQGLAPAMGPARTGQGDDPNPFNGRSGGVDTANGTRSAFAARYLGRVFSEGVRGVRGRLEERVML